MLPIKATKIHSERNLISVLQQGKEASCVKVQKTSFRILLRGSSRGSRRQINFFFFKNWFYDLTCLRTSWRTLVFPRGILMRGINLHCDFKYLSSSKGEGET